MPRRLLRDIPVELRDVTTWPAVDACALPPKDQSIFLKRKNAIMQRLADTSLDAVRLSTCCSRREVNRLLNRCLKIDPLDGRIFGFRALVPYSRVKTYFRLKDVTSRRGTAGYAGMLTRTFRRYPEIETGLRAFILKKRKNSIGPEIPRAPIRIIFKTFLQLCRDAGIKETEYPFTTDGMAKSSLGGYVRSLYRSDMFAMVHARNGKAAARALKFGTGIQLLSPIVHPLQRVIFDGHRLHGSFIIKIPGKTGGFINVLIERPWILVIIDVITRAIIAWHICLGSEFSSADVLACIRKAVTPQQRPILTIPKMEFAKGSGMPSWDIPEMKWALWSELSYDRALANISDWVRAKVVGTLDGAVNAGPVHTPELRAIIERFFETLESYSCHLFPNTSGTNFTDTRRDDPEGNALRYQIELKYIEEVLSVVIANYNGTPHETLGWRSPLEQLRHYLLQGHGIIRTLPLERRDGVELLTLRVVVNIRGNISKGRRPYINYLRERYTNPVLASQPQLIDEKLEIAIREDDLSTVRAFLLNGNEIGVLKALGSWRHNKHSMLVRKQTNKLYKNRIKYESETDDPAQILLNHLRDQAPTSKRAASEYERVRRELGGTELNNSKSSSSQHIDTDEDESKMDFEPMIIYE